MSLTAETYITRTQQAIGVFCIIMLGLSLVVLLFVEVPDKNQGAVGLVIGAIIANSGQVINWLFGSTKESRDKDKAISIMADTASKLPDGKPHDAA